MGVISEAIVGIIGQGFVGNAVFQKFKNYFTVKTYDLDESKSNSSLDEVSKSDFIFVCLPTPMNKDGSCDISIVENVIKKLDKNYNPKNIIIKSTIPPGTTDLWNKKYYNNIVFNPEFLTEKNAVNDYNSQKRIIIGGDKSNIESLNNIFLYVFLLVLKFLI